MSSAPTKNRKTVPPGVFAEIRRLHFRMRRLVNEGVAGGYRSAFRGQGLEFEEVREYTPGDDIRSIDWKVTARLRKPYVKSYREERELNVMIALDVSGSTHTGSRGKLRSELIAQIGGALTLVAMRNNDRVGLVTFSDQIDRYFPPRRNRSSAWRVLHEVLLAEPTPRGTDFSGLCDFLSGVLHRRSVVFIVSDFNGDGFQRALARLGKRHDVTALVVADVSEAELPEVGLVTVVDPETAETRLIDLSTSADRESLLSASQQRWRALERTFRACDVGAIRLETDQPFIGSLRRYFESRRAAPLSSRSVSASAGRS
ncbi:MAG: DUF58 domain-containing protein [Deltaproteobacteria bacterium]|nr:DUF58 domain-containing protein [Deltaproteobacteria bacterium]